jgi:hypothetical protein
LEEDKEDMTVPFDEGSQVMHVVGRHGAFIMQGPCCEVFQVTATEGTINDAWNVGMWLADVGDKILDALKAGQMSCRGGAYKQKGQFKLPDRLTQDSKILWDSFRSCEFAQVIPTLVKPRWKLRLPHEARLKSELQPSC